VNHRIAGPGGVAANGFSHIPLPRLVQLPEDAVSAKNYLDSLNGDTPLNTGISAEVSAYRQWSEPGSTPITG